MDPLVKGYTICVTLSVLIAMISVLMSTELHIRSLILTPKKQEVIVNEESVRINPSYRMKTYDFRRTELKSEIENRRVLFFRDYLKSPIQGIPTALQSSIYSSIHRIDSGNGFDLIFLRNVCYDAESMRLILFTDLQDNSKFSSIMKDLPRQDLFAVVEGQYPQLETEKDQSVDGNYLFLTDSSMDSISQFATVNFLLHFALHSTKYPSLLRAFLPFLSMEASSDIYEYLSILQSLYPSQRPVLLYYREDMTSGLTCYRELTVPTLIQYAEEGSIHLDLYEADTVRLAAYRYYKFYSKLPVPTTAIVLHAKSRAEVLGERGTILNMDELDAFFKKKVAIWSYRSIVMDEVSKATKLHALFETDILFGVSQSLFVNMIYMVPGSCVVVVSPELISSSHFNSIAEQSQLLFLEISNFSIPLPDTCKDRSSNVVAHMYSEKCWKELNQRPVYVQPGMLMSYLRVAKTYTMIHKYYDESEGDYV
ncbi:hypothetical protein WA171_004355 [Blastocystis sp. BT1]